MRSHRASSLVASTAATLILSSAGSLLAQSADPGTDTENDVPETTLSEEIVVSANRVDTPAEEVGSAVTVITREEIERRHQTSVLELLRTVPGLEVAQTGGPGRVASVFIRGGNSAHTLVLIDGMRINDNNSGEFSISDLTADNVERIEVLRGPQGGLYGSEAVTGVVSITTRRGEGPARAWLGGEVGTEGLYRLRAGVAGGNPRWDYSVGLQELSTDGISAASEAAGNTEDDSWENFTASGRFGAAFAGDGRVDLAVRYTDGDTGVDGFAFGVGPVDDLDARQKRETLTAGLTVSKPFAAWWNQVFYVGSGQDELIGEDPGDVFNNFEITSSTSEFLTQSELALAENDTLTIGYRVEKREGDNVGSFDESLYQRSFFAQNLWSWRDRHHLTVSVRNDDHSRFGDETSYRFTGSLLFGEGTRVHGTFGTGFKAPTFNDLFFPGFGNLDLRPETSEGWDLGVEQTLLGGALAVDLTWFDNEFEDLIQFTFPAGFVNVASATSQGLELTARWEPSEKMLLQASHTFTETEDLATGEPLARRPEHRSTLYAAFEPAPRLRGTASLIVVRDRIDSDGSTMDDYERIDLSLDYQATRWLKPYLRLENVLDEDYSEIPGYTAPGLTAAVGLDLGL